MSKSEKKSDFSYANLQDRKPLDKVKTTWDLKKHYYQSESDPQIEKDAKFIETKIRVFCNKYKNQTFTKNTKLLKSALLDYKNLCEHSEAEKVIRYFSFRTTTNVNDTVAAKLLQQYAERFRKLSNELVFFKLTIGKIPVKDQKKFLADNSLSEFNYLLKQAFESGKHQLSESEEKILTLRSNTSCGMWAAATEKIISNRKIKYQNKEMALPEAIEEVNLQSWENKSILWDLILTELVQISEFAEHELTAIVNHEKISDELRGYKKPYSSTVKAYENSEKAVTALVETISTKGFELSKKFYKLKAKIHGQKTIPYVNKYDPIGPELKPSFQESIEICRDVFYSVKEEYGEIFDKLFLDGQVDVYPKAGKRGGAFMSATENLPTFVMLNHKDDFKSLETIAHEMGHAVHAECSKVQSVLYEDFSTTTAETASTLFEQFVLERIYEQLSDEQRVVFLHDKIGRDIATVQRQIACFNYELEMHNTIRNHGMATKDELAKMMQKHLKSYLGPAVDVSEKEGYFFVAWPHIRYGFYVYTYTYGHLISNLMVQKYNKDPKYVEKIDKFLTSGGIDTVENIFKSIGINTNKIETFEASLETQNEEINKLAKLI